MQLLIVVVVVVVVFAVVVVVVVVVAVIVFFFFFSHFYSPASGPAVVTDTWTRWCRPFSPPVLAFNSFRALGSAIPLLVGFSSVCC